MFYVVELIKLVKNYIVEAFEGQALKVVFSMLSGLDIPKGQGYSQVLKKLISWLTLLLL